MKAGAPGAFGTHLKALREAAGFTQEELATIAGLSVHAVSALERGERRRPHVDTVRALAAALDLSGPGRDEFVRHARASATMSETAAEELTRAPLPTPPTALVGRDADLASLHQWLDAPGTRLVTIVGPGGVGKTRLALEVARGIAEEGATRVTFVELAAIRDASQVAAAIGDALGLPDITASDLPATVRRLGPHPRLLLVDNFEQVLEAAPVIAALLTAAPALRLLVTSRAPLRVRGERLYPLGRLTLPPEGEEGPDDQLGDSPAVRLFVARVVDVQPGFRLTPGNTPIVAAICRKLDALPLALELAAPWMKTLAPEGVLRRLEDDILLCPAGPRDLPPRQQTMNATVAWSYQLLGGDERRAFRRLAVMPRRLPGGAAAWGLAADDGPWPLWPTLERLTALRGNR